MWISYADTTIGAIFFNVDLERELDRGWAQQLVETALRRRRGEISTSEWGSAVQWFLMHRRRSLLVHETCHILQAVAYPAVFLRCLREERLVNQTFLALRRSGEIRGDGRIQAVVPEEWRTTLEAPVVLYRVARQADGKVTLELGDRNRPGPGDFTETDLLEADASLFQYRAEIGGPGQASGYLRWLRERGRSSLVFKCVARILDDADAAYVATQALMRAAYTTSWPMTTFVGLLELTRRFGLEDTDHVVTRIGADTFYDVLLGWLERALPETAPLPQPSAPAGSDAYVRIDDQGHRSLVAAGRYHPLAGLAEQYLEHRTADGDFPDWFHHPYRHLNNQTDKFSQELQGFRAPMIVTRLVHPTLRINDTVLDFSTDPPPPGLRLQTSNDHIQFLRYRMYAKNLVFGMITDNYVGDPHNCPHDACPWHITQLCKKWAPIPERFGDCSFPAWVEDLLAHRLRDDPDGARLEPIEAGRAS